MVSENKTLLNKMEFINGFQLKMIALITMTIDHIGSICFPTNIFLRQIGRMALPIYIFLLVEGITHTKNINKYLLRLIVLALISEIPFDYAFFKSCYYLGYQNIFFTLSLGLIAVCAIQKYQNKFLQFVLIGLISYFAEIIKSDYGYWGVLFVVVAYYLRKNKIVKQIPYIVFNVFLYGGVQSYGALSVIPIFAYNGKRGYPLKYFFYIYYPIHLIMIRFIFDIVC